MIEFQNVSKSFGGQDVLIEVSFRINPRERVGIVGPNGAGKSTLFSLVMDELGPDKGTVTVGRGIRLGHLRQQLTPARADISLIDYVEDAVSELRDIQHELDTLTHQMPPEDSPERLLVLDRLGDLQTTFENLGGYDLRHRAEAALSGLGFSTTGFERPFIEFSGGWQMRAELARTLVARPDLLLLDEPSNYLDLPAIEWLQRYLREFSGTLVLISHDRYLLNQLTSLTYEVLAGRITRYPGNCDYYLREREARAEQALTAWKVQERRKAQVERFIERFRAKNTKATQVQSRIAMLDKMDAVAPPPAALPRPRIRLAPPPHSGSEVMRLDNAGISYDGQRWILRHVELSIQRGDKTALVGLNGLGKTTLLRALAGALPLGEGQRVLGHKVNIGYQAQDFADQLPMDQTVLNVIKASGQLTEQQTRALLGSFGFAGDAVEKRCGVLSGGEKIRLAFARLLTHPPNFLILDEPTTHLDMTSRAALEEALAAYEGTVCFVSHDVEFVRHVATSILAMTPPGVTRYYGGYDYYKEKLAAETQPARPSQAPALNPSGLPAQAAPTDSDPRAGRKAQARQDRNTAKRRRQLEKSAAEAETRVDTLHSEQADLLKVLAAATVVTDYAGINSRLTAIQQEIAEATQAWEQAAEALGAMDQP